MTVPTSTAISGSRERQEIRRSLKLSQRESFASSLMTGSYDQYMNAFAIWLGATAVQIGWLNSLPQVLGALLQIGAVWLGFRFNRHRLIVAGAVLQCLGLATLQLAIWPQLTASPLYWLLVAVVCYHAGANVVQPHWRAMMGSLVPDRLRGRFFSRRTRIAMMTSFLTFVVGGLALNWYESRAEPWLGFLLLFSVALGGRLLSVSYLARMKDPPDEDSSTLAKPASLWPLFRELWRDRRYRRFVTFMAGLQCFVALSAPFFAVYMLRDLEFSYLQFTLNVGASILIQFLMLPFWGRVCDRKGNRYVMAIGASIIPVLPILWLASDSPWFLMGVQIVGGAAWSGFSLASANYLYDFQPSRSSFASYAALQAALGAIAISLGSLAGGYLIPWIPPDLSLAGITVEIERPIAVVFILSTLLRAVIVLWYMPTAPELRVAKRGRVRDLVFRIARFTPISGVMLDVINRRRR